MSRQQGSIYAQTLQSGKKVWKVEVEIGRKPDGTRIRRRRTAYSLQEARLEKRKLLDLAETGFQAAQANQRLDVFAYWWIREVKAWTIKAATAADYEHRYRRHISPIGMTPFFRSINYESCLAANNSWREDYDHDEQKKATALSGANSSQNPGS